ncbi:DUF3137 domain-containing protein [Campylobacter showae]|jgi:hypothetical protein|uniref:DUF3137 domain-containing protein n=1 Tax=Campylobacter showae TaxID=204 RepID=UPI001F132A27|nr:DUF3137 domain-containing protein [Campylobacter showae]
MTVTTFVAPILIFIIMERRFEIFFLLFAVIQIYVTPRIPKVEKTLEEYRSFYKNVFVSTVIADIDSNFTYEPQKGISANEFYKSGIYRRVNFYGEDQISGTYANVKFQLSEAIKIEKKYDSNGSKNPYLALLRVSKVIYDEYMDFNGTVLVCEFYKNFKGQTILADKKVLNTKISGEKEILDDTDFNKEFRVFTDDKIEARYLLSPAFMRRLHDVKIKFDGAVSLSAAFMDDKFYLFLNGAKDRFESSLFAQSPSLADVQTIKYEISQLLRIIYELNLSLDVYK